MYWWNKLTDETTVRGAPKPLSGPWQTVRHASGQTYYWNRHTNQTTALGVVPPWLPLVPCRRSGGTLRVPPMRRRRWVRRRAGAAAPAQSSPVYVSVEQGRVCMLAAMGYLKTGFSWGIHMAGQRPLLWTAEDAQRALMALTCMFFPASLCLPLRRHVGSTGRGRWVGRRRSRAVPG